MNEFKRIAWMARNESGDLWIYDEKPHKANPYNWVSSGSIMDPVDSNLFPSVKWEDEEPTEVEIMIKPKKRCEN